MQVEQLLLDMVKAVVDYPTEASVSRKEHDNGNVELEVRVRDSDVGKVVGRNGQTLHALRQVIMAATVRENRKTGWFEVTVWDPRVRADRPTTRTSGT